MKIRVIVLGKHKDDYIQQAVADFQKKLRQFCELEWMVLKDEKVAGEVKKILQKEAHIIDKTLGDDFLVVLDENGRSFGSEEFAHYFSDLQDKGLSRVTFVVGSAHGLDPSIKQKADLLLSLSPMTMSHQLVRPVLLEQLYRMFSIQRGTGYHK